MRNCAREEGGPFGFGDQEPISSPRESSNGKDPSGRIRIPCPAAAIEDAVLSADVMIGAVLIPGAAAPKLVTEQMLSRMKQGAVLVDIAIDQGGCFESSHATTHAAPTFIKGGVLHYCVANMPGAVPFNAHAGAGPRSGWCGVVD